MDTSDFEAAGLYDPTAPDASERLALLEHLDAHGVPIETMQAAAAANSLHAAASDATVRPGQRRTIEQRRAALIEVANEAEQVALLDWDEISPDEFQTWQPSAELAAALPEATCTAEVTEEISLPAARRIRLSVNWPNASGQLREPIAVTIWKFKEERP